MRNPLKALFPAVAALCLAATASATDITWYADYDVAAKEAMKSGKDLLVDFTGSDWCIWCKRLDAEVYEHAEFAEGVSDDFVFVALDFPNSEEAKAKVPNPDRNDELQEQFGIMGFPTILLLTPQGELYARTGYQPGGPEKYVEHLHSLQSSGKAALAQIGTVIAAYEQAEGDAKLVGWDELAVFAESLDSESPFVARVVPPLEAAFTFDASNEQGRKRHALETLFGLGQMDDAMLSATKALDPDNGIGLLEQTLPAKFSAVRNDETARAAIAALTEFEAAARFKDTGLQTQLYASVAMWLAGPLADKTTAAVWAGKALALKPDNTDMVARLEKIVSDG